LLSSTDDRMFAPVYLPFPFCRILCSLGRIALAALSLCAIAQAASVEELRYDYYTVEAPRKGSLAAAVTAASAFRSGGKTYHGHTQWDVVWHFDWKSGPDGSCRVTAASTELKAVVTLPNLAGGDTQQVAIFNRYISVLRQHELGHYQNGKAAERAVYDELIATPAMGSCPALERRVNAQARATIARFIESDRDYDRRTEHGVAQGALLAE
jgi:predicted secreted Zn-dependent protease